MAKTDEPEELPKGLIRSPRPALVYTHGAPWRWERSGALAAATMRVRGGRPGGAPVPEWQRAEPFRVPSQYSIPSVGPQWADVSFSAVARWGIAPPLATEGQSAPVTFRDGVTRDARPAGDSRESKGRRVRWSPDHENAAAWYVLHTADPDAPHTEASRKRAIRATLQRRTLPLVDAEARFQRAVAAWVEACAAHAVRHGGVPAFPYPLHPSVVAAAQSARLLDGIGDSSHVKPLRAYREAVDVYSVFDPAEARVARALADWDVTPHGVAPHLPDVPHAPTAHSGIAGASEDCPWCGAWCRGVTRDRTECPVMVTARDGAHGRAPNLETRAAILAAQQAWKEEKRVTSAVAECDAFILSMVGYCDALADHAASHGETDAVSHYDRLSSRWRRLADSLHAADGTGDATVADAVESVSAVLPPPSDAPAWEPSSAPKRGVWRHRDAREGAAVRAPSRPDAWWIPLVRTAHETHRRVASLRLAAVTRIRASLDGAQVSPVVTEQGAPKGAPMLRRDGTIRGILVTPGESGIAATTVDAGRLYPCRPPRKPRETYPDHRAPAPVQELRARPVYAPGIASGLPRGVLAAPPPPPSSGPGFRGAGPLPRPEAPAWHWTDTPEAPAPMGAHAPDQGAAWSDVAPDPAGEPPHRLRRRPPPPAAEAPPKGRKPRP